MSDGKLLNGQQYDAENDLVVQYTQQMREISSADTLLGNSLTEIIPTDGSASIVRQYKDPSNLATYYFASPTTVNLQLPDTLIGIEIAWSESGENGQKTVGPGTFLFAGAGSGSLTASSSASSGGSIMPDVQPLIKQIWANNIPATRYLFYIKGVNVTQAQVLNRLSDIVTPPSGPAKTVLACPVFKPQAITITMSGQQLALQCSAEAHAGLNAASGGVGGEKHSGKGFSVDTRTTVKTLRIPPTLHAKIDLTTQGTSKTKSISATASAYTPQAEGTYNSTKVTVDAQNETQTKNLDVSGNVSPSQFSATSPASVPTTGLYAVQIECKLWKYNWTAVQAVVVDFSTFA